MTARELEAMLKIDVKTIYSCKRPKLAVLTSDKGL